jgi:proton-dependent oligopeptide transporter, POT family
MLISLATFVFFKKFLPDPSGRKTKESGDTAMPWEAEKKRLMALGLVFLVVIFFWMSFHQNGLTMTFFARDYTAKHVDPLSYLVFDIKGLLLIAAMIAGVVVAIQKGTWIRRSVGMVMAVGGAAMLWFLYGSYPASNLLEPEVFQQFNPYFVVFLTPVVVGLFAWLRSKGKEPSTPKKIGIGMLLAAPGFTLLLVCSFGLPSPAELGGGPSPDRVSPNWLISTYFILTVAELFLSPMGLSFVSKVAPPRFQGLMQGGWLGATAIGNQLLVVGSLMWARFNVWTVWAVFVVCCLISATVIFAMSRWLNAMTSAGTEKKA